MSTEGLYSKTPYNDELGVIVLQEWVDLNHDDEVEVTPVKSFEQDHKEEQIEELTDRKEEKEEKEEKTVEVTPLKLSAKQQKRRRRQYA